MSVGSLAQSARKKDLSRARNILIFIGVLTVIVNGIQLGMAEDQIREAFAQDVAAAETQGMVLDMDKVAELEESALSMARLIVGAAVAVGVVFIVLGAIVKKFPVVSTVTGLVLYVGSVAVFGMIDPSTLARGLVMKIIVVVFLAKAVQAAAAYQRESHAHAH